MNEQAFIAAHDTAWQRLAALEDKAMKSGLTHLTRQELREIGPLYRRAASDLAFAKSRTMSPELIARLNGLTATGHGLLYQTDTRRWKGVLSFLRNDFPQAFRRQFAFFLAALALTILGFFAAYAVVMKNESNIDLFIPPGSGFRDSMEYWRAGKTENSRPDGESARMAGFYIANNTNVSFTAFAVGILGGVFTVFILIQNGAMVGALTGVISHHHQHASYWPALVPHGVVELSAIFISAGAGLSLGWAVLVPGKYSRRDAIMMAARDSVPMVIGTIVLLLFAGFVEAFVSHSLLPRPMKVAFGIASGVALYGFLFFSGRQSSIRSLTSR